jgi:hypothetical protein
MQRRAGAVYVALFLVITIGSYGAFATASPPPIEVQPDYEFQQGSTETIDGTTYNATELNGTAGEATLAWADGNESTGLTEGANVSLGDTTYTAHFEGETLQLTSDQEAYMDEVRAIQSHEDLKHSLFGVSILSGLATALMIGAAFMPVRS